MSIKSESAAVVMNPVDLKLAVKQEEIPYSAVKKIKDLLPNFADEDIVKALAENTLNIGATLESLLSKPNITKDVEMPPAVVSQKRILDTSKETPNSKKQKLTEQEDFALALQLQEEMNAPPKKPVPKSSAYIIPLPYGVILFKGCLNTDEQLGIFKLVCELADIQYKAAKSSLTKMMNLYKPNSKTTIASLLTYNWNYTQKIKEKPTDLLEFGKNMFTKAHQYLEDNPDIQLEQTNSDYTLPKKYNPDGLHAILYPEGGSLHGHHDGIQGWVLSVSIGQSADFYFSDKDPSAARGSLKTVVKLESGDVIIFNGAKVWHGVENVRNNECPKFWREVETWKYGRFNLQFRDPSFKQKYDE